MISRYSRAEMARIWGIKNKYKKWLEVEIAVCEAWNNLGKIPDRALETIKRKASFDVRRIEEIEKEVKHDVIAFLTSVAENVGKESRFIHMGLTSSDIIDTSFALMLREAAIVIIDDIKGLMDIIKERATKDKSTVIIGRTHGIHAEPTTFGFKMALWYEEMKRNLSRMERALDTISFGKISGAVGTFANIPPFVEEYVCKRLGLRPAPVSSQVLQRDRHAEYFTTISIIATSIEKFAIEIRHLQRSEVREVEEPFTKGQKGSSAMPHKRNPILSENLSGLARLIRGYAQASLDNIPLWHERDISHSSVERIVAPDATILIDFMLTRLAFILNGLKISPDMMENNLNILGGLIFSQRVLLKMIDKGESREVSYLIVQRNAMRAWRDGGDFRKLLMEDPDVLKRMNADEINACFDISYYTKNIDYIFKRVFEKEL